MKHAAAVVALLMAAISPVFAAEPAEVEILWEALAPGGGPPTIPAVRGDLVYLAATVRDAEGEPLSGVELSVSSKNGNRLAGPNPVSQEGGYAEFQLSASQPGLDSITVTAGQASDEIRLDVGEPEGLKALTEGKLAGIKGVTDWPMLMRTSVEYDADYKLSATVDPAVKKLVGKTVRLAGFMMPLGMSEKQERFILAANPPTCFFHLPGGPTTVAAIEMKKGIDLTWEPMVVEGRLETKTQTDDGVIYRLRDARVVEP
jgi:hypothetical protein